MNTPASTTKITLTDQPSILQNFFMNFWQQEKLWIIIFAFSITSCVILTFINIFNDETESGSIMDFVFEGLLFVAAVCATIAFLNFNALLY